MAVVQAVEIDTALPVTPLVPLFVDITQALETDTAFAVSAVMGTLFPTPKRTACVLVEHRTYVVARPPQRPLTTETRSWRVPPEVRIVTVPPKI